MVDFIHVAKLLEHIRVDMIPNIRRDPSLVLYSVLYNNGTSLYYHTKSPSRTFQADDPAAEPDFQDVS
jgi:hypothetical protein